MTISPHTVLPISLDTLRGALSGPTLQSQVSATELYDALKMDMQSDPAPPHKAPLSVAERKKYHEEVAEEYYLRRMAITLTRDGEDVPDSTNVVKMRTADANRVDVLARALRALGPQNQISATTLYHALRTELGRGERNDQSRDHVIDNPKDEPLTQKPTGPDLVHRYTKAQVSQEAGEEYTRWLDAHPGFWNLSHHTDNIDVATKKKSEG